MLHIFGNGEGSKAFTTFKHTLAYFIYVLRKDNELKILTARKNAIAKCCNTFRDSDALKVPTALKSLISDLGYTLGNVYAFKA